MAKKSSIVAKATDHAKPGSSSSLTPATKVKGELPLLDAFVPPSFLKLCLVYVIAIPIAVGTALLMLRDVLRSGRDFWRAKDRSSLPLPDAVAGFQHEYIKTNGIRLHAVSPSRQPSKPLMLLVHGFPECWYSWRHVMTEFATEYDVVAIDMRGYNLSDKPEGVWRYSLDHLVGDIEGAIKALGHSSCTLVGHDWGGAVVWAAAAMHPHLIDKLVVLAAPHLALFELNMDLKQALMSWYILLFQVPYVPELMMGNRDAKAVAVSLTPGAGPMAPQRMGSVSPQDIEVYKQAWQRPGVATAAINYYRALFGYSAPAVFSAMRRPIRVPTLCLWGDKDGALGVPLLNDIDKVVPGVEVVVLKDCSHWIQQDQPEELNRHMHAFLGGTKKTA